MNRLQDYIHQKLSDLDKEKDMTDVVQKGKISFGISSAEYGHLAGWTSLVKNKKSLVKKVRGTSAFVSLGVVGFVTEIWDQLDQNWIRAILYWLFTSAFVMFLFVISSYYSIFYHFRRAEREVRRLIYQDILRQLEKEGIPEKVIS